MAFTRLQLQVNQTLPSPTGASGDYVFHPYQQPPSPNFSILVVAIIGIVTTAFLLLSYYVFVIKFRLNWHHLSHRFRRFRSFRHLSGLENYHEQPVLYTTNNGGLEQCAIQSIPVILFKKTDSCFPVDVNDCAVCLNQFDEGERLRILPICSHSFHIDCIDTWLQSHANCPVCRSSVSNTSVSHQYVIEIENPFAETHLGLHSNGENGFRGNVFPSETHDPSQSMEMSVQVDQAVQSSPADRNGRTQNFVESSGFFEVKFRNRKSEAGTKKIHHKHRLSGSGDECVDLRHRHDDEFSIEPIRRSFSMDSCADVQLYISLAEILEQNPHLKRVGTSEHKAKRNFSPLNPGRGAGRNAVVPVTVEPKISLS